MDWTQSLLLTPGFEPPTIGHRSKSWEVFLHGSYAHAVATREKKLLRVSRCSRVSTTDRPRRSQRQCAYERALASLVVDLSRQPGDDHEEEQPQGDFVQDAPPEEAAPKPEEEEEEEEEAPEPKKEEEEEEGLVEEEEEEEETLASPTREFCRRFRTPPTTDDQSLYIARCVAKQLIPEPVVGKQLPRGVLNVSHMSIGDEVAMTLAPAIRHFSRIAIADNRLTHRGITALADEMSPELDDLDLSENYIDWRGAVALSSRVERLRSLNLAQSGLGSRSIVLLTRCCAMLEELNLNRNPLDETSAEAIADLCRRTQTLRDLQLMWTNLRRRSGAAVCRGIARSKVATADLSWNAWYQDAGDDSAVAGLAFLLSTSQHLTHLDVSHSRIGVADVEQLGAALESNRTLLGLHMKGNAGACNAYGFLEPPTTKRDIAGEAHVFSRRNATLDAQCRNWSASDNCWICQKWVEHRFLFTPGLSCPPCKTPEELQSLRVSLKTDIDNFQIHPMRRCNDQFELWRMVPPDTTIHYSFVLSSVIAPKRRGKRRPSGGTRLAATTECIAADQAQQDDQNTVQVHHLASSSAVVVSPRDVVDVDGKRKWSVKKSIFAQYKVDTTGTNVADAFDADYAMTNLGRVLATKDVEEDPSQEARSLLRTNYDVIKGAFKQFALLGGTECFTMGWNAFTDFVLAIDLPDKKWLSRSDVDMAFFTSSVLGPPSPKNSKKTLCRFQFLDAVVRLALKRWHASGECPCPAEAMKRLVDTIRDLPSVETAERAAAFHKKMWTQETDQLLRQSMDLLALVYERYSGKEDKPGQPKLMSLSEWLTLGATVGFFDNDGLFSERDAKQAFARALQTVTDEMTTDKHRRLAFLEFVEALIRVATFSVVSDDSGDDATIASSRSGGTTRTLSPVDALKRVVDSLPAALRKPTQNCGDDSTSYGDRSVDSKSKRNTGGNKGTTNLSTGSAGSTATLSTVVTKGA